MLTNAVAVILFLSGGFCAGLVAAYWWLNGYQQELSDRMRRLEAEVADDTHEHWLEGARKGEKDWDWPGKGY